jgi:phenylpyruvate tautomerase PptA (4-oxalocrotonate tautomerase family)
MPHLQLDTTGRYPLEVKRELAQRIGDLYAQTMQTSAELVDVTIRELGEGNVWRCGDDGPRPSAVMSCEVRRGRAPEQRAALGEGLFQIAGELLGIDPLDFGVEYTQHPGDEIYRAILVDGVVTKGFSKDWSQAEVDKPLYETLREERRQPA